VLSPEYRRGDVQLVLANSGNGTHANPRGSAVYCTHLNTGEETRFERSDVLGVVRPEAIPQWAKDSLARIQGKDSKITANTSAIDMTATIAAAAPALEKQYVAKYEILDRREVGHMTFVLGHNPDAVSPYATWQGRKGKDAAGYNAGHYFSTHEAAKDDLLERASREQRFIDRRKRDAGAR